MTKAKNPSAVSRLTGRPINRCAVNRCNLTAYAEGLCYTHFQEREAAQTRVTSTGEQ